MPTSTTRPGPIAWATAVVLTLYMLTPIPTWPLNAWPTLGLMLVLPALAGLVLLHHLAGRPVLLCGLLALLWCVSPAVLGPALVAQQLVAVTKRHRSSALTATVLLAGKAVWAGYALLDPQSRDSELLFETILSVGGIVVATVVGLCAAQRPRVRPGPRRRNRPDATPPTPGSTRPASPNGNGSPVRIYKIG